MRRAVKLLPLPAGPYRPSFSAALSNCGFWKEGMVRDLSCSWWRGKKAGGPARRLLKDSTAGRGPGTYYLSNPVYPSSLTVLALTMLKPPSVVPATELDRKIFDATIPPDHYLRRVKQAVDFEGCRDLLAAVYHASLGRPALEPVLLLRLEFLQYHYNLSDR